tara:strand:+ start:78 stop:1088 length:1011 start_codon:yes stop_codon:yes gene_type:complete
MSFKRFDAEDFVVSSDSITSTLWSTDSPTLTEFYTSSIQDVSSAGNFYLSIFQTASIDPNRLVQFDISYGDLKGSGSTDYNIAVPGKSPTTSVYGQYRALVLEDENASFLFGTENNIYTSENFWVLSIERARYKESIFPGSLNLTLAGPGGSIQLTDNSRDTLVNSFIGSTRVIQIVSGSNGLAFNGDGYVPNSGSYGLLLPELGTILLNPAAISQSIGVEADRTSGISNGTNNAILYNSIVSGSFFTLNSQETITSDYIFIRSRNSEFNYTQNPTFISGTTGEVIYSNFINNPQTYITTVGLYNDSNELLAIAKLSRPLIKDFTKESLVRVKLDF